MKKDMPKKVKKEKKSNGNRVKYMKMRGAGAATKGTKFNAGID